MIWAFVEVCRSGIDRPGGVIQVCPVEGWQAFATGYPWLLAVWVVLMATAIWTERRKDNRDGA